MFTERLQRELPMADAARVSSGFTLFETIIALVILGFVLAGIAMMMVGSIETGRDARRFTAAGALAQQKLEDLRALKYADAASSGSPETLSESGATSGVTPFQREWTVADNATAGIKDVTVSVSWSDNEGPHRVQLQSRIVQ